MRRVMKMLFAPAVRLMNRLKYPQKFTLISLLFALPLALVMGLLLLEINNKVAFSRKEIYGTTYLRPLRQLLEHTLYDKILDQDVTANAAALRDSEEQIAA